MNILIIGHGRHGKDTVAEFFNSRFGLKYKSSSLACAEIFIYDLLKEKYGYSTFDECYNDRSNHRKEWYELIVEYNSKDKTRLAREVLSNGTSCYVGMRDRDEVIACTSQNLFDLIIWVDAGERLPLESSESFNITKDLADIVIDNNGDHDSLLKKLENIGKAIFKPAGRFKELMDIPKNAYGRKTASTFSEKLK
jgi:hypothetical protein